MRYLPDLCKTQSLSGKLFGDKGNHISQELFDDLMTKLFRTLALLLTCLLTVSMLAGCGGDDSDSEETVRPANFVSATPPSGSTIPFHASITLTFDNAPADVTVSAGAAVPSGKTVTVKGPFFPGPLSLSVSWADGTQTLIYTVTGPD